jgi:uncharacterized membrane protein
MPPCTRNHERRVIMADELAVGLFCFDGATTGGSARRAFLSRLRSNGDRVLQTTVVRVDAKRRTTVHDPERVLKGTLTSALTWGAFGLVAGTDKLLSTVVWAVLGAVCGGLNAYVTEHLLAKDELSRIGRHLPAPSSALVLYARTSEPKRVLEASAPAGPTVGSVAVVGGDLSTDVYAGVVSPLEVSHRAPGAPPSIDQASLTSMVLLRYPDPKAASRVAAEGAQHPATGRHRLQTELVVATDAGGRRHVADPSHGVWAMAKSDIISWGAFGLVFGAIVGLVGGGGILGFLSDGLATGIGWAVFGLVAGALYGLWAGRSISARRLHGLGDLLPAGSSALLAWSDGPVHPAELEALDDAGSQRLILSFNPVHGGAVLEAG